MENRAGRYVQNLSGELAYKSFSPSPLPPDPPVEINADILKALIEAARALSYLDGLVTKVSDIDLFIAMCVRKEALLSSQIEGTQCTLDDILNPQLEEKINSDVSDVLSYVKAEEAAIERLKTLPLCCRLIKEAHAILLEEGRGKDKSPGEFRVSQNWIGGVWSTLRNARYIPPNPEDMERAMSDLEKFINYDDTLDPLIQAALIHYQFETIHPFLDGNGRIGRLIIILFLIEKKILHAPVLYISYYLKMNRIEYYDRMTEVRKSGNYEQWIEFFLSALSSSATDAIETINKLSTLHEDNYKKILDTFNTRQRVNILKLFDYLERSPIIEIGKTSQILGLSYNTVSTGVEALKRMGILKENPRNGRRRTFSYDAYLEILRKDT